MNWIQFYAADLTEIVLKIILSFDLPEFGLALLQSMFLKKSKDPAYPQVGKGAGSAGNRISRGFA